MSFLIRFGIVGGVVAGLLIGVPGILESFTGKTTATSFVLAFAGVFGLPLLTALYLDLPRPGRLADVSYSLSIIGTTLFCAAGFAQDALLIHLDRPAQQNLLRGSPRVALLIGLGVFIVGAVLFGATLVGADRYPRVPAFAYPVVLPAFAISATLPYSPYKGIAHAAVAVVLIWLALALARRRLAEMRSASPERGASAPTPHPARF
jgi:hypothetical protein